MVISAKLSGLVEGMPQNLSKEKSLLSPPEHAGEEAQALLRQLMAIYDVKTLVGILLVLLALVGGGAYVFRMHSQGNAEKPAETSKDIAQSAELTLDQKVDKIVAGVRRPSERVKPE